MKMTTLLACRRYGGGKDAIDGYVAGYNDAYKEFEAENARLRQTTAAARRGERATGFPDGEHRKRKLMRKAP